MCVSMYVCMNVCTCGLTGEASSPEVNQPVWENKDTFQTAWGNFRVRAPSSTRSLLRALKPKQRQQVMEEKYCGCSRLPCAVDVKGIYPE